MNIPRYADELRAISDEAARNKANATDMTGKEIVLFVAAIKKKMLSGRLSAAKNDQLVTVLIKFARRFRISPYVLLRRFSYRTDLKYATLTTWNADIAM
jgi:hypothetical protein